MGLGSLRVTMFKGEGIEGLGSLRVRVFKGEDFNGYGILELGYLDDRVIKGWVI